MRDVIILIGIVIAIIVGSIGVGSAVAGEEDHGNTVARVYGCPSEDSCKIDYTHRGVWVITRITP